MPTSHPPPSLANLRDELHLWRLPVAGRLDDVGWRRARAWLDAGERERLDALRFERDRRLYLWTHAGLRAVLATYTGAPPDTGSLTADPGGKPRLMGPGVTADLELSLSHTRGLGLCLLTRGVPCGVDVERTDRAGDPWPVARRVLRDGEQTRLRAAPDDRVRREFTRYWTLKEAVLKALGVGLARAFTDVELDLAGARPRLAFLRDDDPGCWQLRLDDDGGIHVLAAAWRDDRAAPRTLVDRTFDLAAALDG